ncbi:hypothetical protein Tco_0146794 [Tanacetum coccineum]
MPRLWWRSWCRCGGGGVLRGSSGGDVRWRWREDDEGGVGGEVVAEVLLATSDDMMRATGMVCVDGGRDGVAVGMVMMALVVEVWRGDEMVAARLVVSDWLDSHRKYI